MIQKNLDYRALSTGANASHVNNGVREDGTELGNVYSGVIGQLESRNRSKNRNSLIVGMTSSVPGGSISHLIKKLGEFCSESLNRRTLLIDFSVLPSNGSAMNGSTNGSTNANGSANGLPANESKAEFGFWNFVSGESQIDELIGGDSNSKVAYLKPGVANTVVSFSDTSESFDKLRNDYDIILVDLPSSSHMLNGIAVDELLDSVILVVHSGKSGKQDFRDAVSRLTERNVNFGGVVLDKVEKDMPSFENIPGDIIDMVFACIRFAKTVVKGFFRLVPLTCRKVYEAWQRQR